MSAKAIADFFFLVGLPDDFDFEAHRHGGGAHDGALKSDEHGKHSDVDLSRSATIRPRQSSRRNESSAAPTTRLQPDGGAQDVLIRKSSPGRVPTWTKTSDGADIDDPFGLSFKADTFSLEAFTDPSLKINKFDRPVSRDLSRTDHSLHVRNLKEEDDQFNDSPQTMFASVRREKNNLIRKLSNSSTLSLTRRASRGRLSNSRPESVVSSLTLKSAPRRISQAYSHVIPDPDPLVPPIDAHPLSDEQKYAPRLLARFPDRSDHHGEAEFPAFLPMFSFPDDITLRPSDERPRSTWHGFSLTRGDGVPLYGMCLILWVPLRDYAAKQIEARCAEWRAKHILPEEREMSASFSTKLAAERTKLSQLLQALSQSRAHERDAANAAINDCEEKIALYTELLKPVRHGTSSNIAGLTKGPGIWAPRALGILGTDGTQQMTWRSWLVAVAASYMQTDLRNVPRTHDHSSPFLPLERYVVNLCQEIPRPPQTKIKIDIAVRSARIEAIREASNDIPGSLNVDLFPLFRTLSIENVLILLEAALVESRIVLISQHCAMLSSASAALVTLLYPFRWEGVFIPVLPRRLISCLDAPTPFIMGISTQIPTIEFPVGDDVVICDLDSNTITHSMKAFLPASIRRKLKYLLQCAIPMHRKLGMSYGAPAYCIEAYPSDSVVRVTTTVPATAPSVADLLILSSSTFAEADYSAIEKPDLNIFLPTRHETKLKRIVPDLQKTSPTNTVRTRPKFKSQFSSFASGLRGKGHTDKRTSLQESSQPRPSMSSRPSMTGPTNRFTSSPSMSSIANSVYARSYSQSMYPAASSIIFDPFNELSNARVGPDNDVPLREGHQMVFHASTDGTACAPVSCDYSSEAIEDAFYSCSACKLTVAEKYIDSISLPCLPAAFDSNKVRAAIVRAMTSLLSNYRKYLIPSIDPSRPSKFTHNRADHEREWLGDPNGNIMRHILDTQLFATFIEDRCRYATTDDPGVLLFDQILQAKRNRSQSLFTAGGKSDLWFLSKSSDGPSSTRKRFTAVAPNGAGVADFLKDSVGVPDCLDDRWLSDPQGRDAWTDNPIFQFK